jgi:hypothetical protein
LFVERRDDCGAGCCIALFSQETFMKRLEMLLMAAVLASVAAMPAVVKGDAAEQAVSSDDQNRSIAGPVQSFNYGPRGAEGIVLSTNGTIVQMNMPPDLAAQVMQSVKVGDEVKVTGEIDNGPPPRPPGRQDGMEGGPQGGPQGGPGEGPQGGPQGGPGGGPQADHAVYRLLTLTDAKGKQYKSTGPGGRKMVHAEGTVKILNYDRRGTVNGAHLENGDVVHLGPREAEEAEIAVGKKLTVDGAAQRLPEGGNLIEAQMVNGVDVRPQGPGGPRGDGPPPR